MSLPEPPRSPSVPLTAWQAVRRFRLGFRPVVFASLKGYSGPTFQRDLLAGLVVGVVSLPLAIAFAIASGADPRAGLITAAVAGTLAALFGGSRLNVTGPTGAFVVILYGIVQGHSIEKLLVAVVMAGILLFLMGALRLGSLIKFIPYPVTTGFTAGIAVIIFLGQLQHILGLRLNGLVNDLHVKVPGDAIGIVETVGAHAERIGWHALAVAFATVLIVQLVKRFIPRVPGPAVALVVMTPIAFLVPGLHLQTVGDLYTIPSGLPTVRVPDFSLATMKEMFPSAITIALLGAIESLLCAVVADGMTGQRHNSNQELMGQGIANVASPFFGGIAATGAIARTATSVQSGARTPVASLVHAGVVLVVLLVAAPYVAYVPMAVLGGILAIVAWNMSERQRFKQLLRMPVADAGVMVTTFTLTVLVDLTTAVEVGLILAAALFVARMASVSQVNVIDPQTDPRYRSHSLEGKEIPAGVVVYSVDGPFFFGAAERFDGVLNQVSKVPRVVIFRMRQVPYLDATALNAFTTTIQDFLKRGTHVLLSGVQGQPFDMMVRSGLVAKVGAANMMTNIDVALERARGLLDPAPNGVDAKAG